MFKNMTKRKHGKRNFMLFKISNIKNAFGQLNYGMEYIGVRQHDPFRVSGCSRCVTNNCQVRRFDSFKAGLKKAWMFSQELLTYFQKVRKSNDVIMFKG